MFLERVFSHRANRTPGRCVMAWVRDKTKLRQSKNRIVRTLAEQAVLITRLTHIRFSSCATHAKIYFAKRTNYHVAPRVCSAERVHRVESKRRKGTTMKNPTWKIACVAAALAASLLPATAQTTDNTASGAPTSKTINQRKENQQDRLGQGIQSGQLTAGEASKLETSTRRNG